MIDESAVKTVAEAIAAERVKQFGAAAGLAPREVEFVYARAAILAYESAKPKVAEGLKLGSRLTVEEVEAVVAPVIDLQPIADVADNYDGMFVEPDVPILAVGTARFRLNNARSIRAVLQKYGKR